MVAGGGEWTHPLLRSAHEQPRAGRVPASGRLALASGAVAPQPKGPTYRWDRMRRLIDRWLPPARVYHPYPLRRMRRHYLR